MPNPNPADDLATKLAAVGPFGASNIALVKGTNLFVGKVRGVRADVPPLSVFCENQPGPRPDPFLGIAKDIDYFQVKVTVRSEPAQYDAGEEVARDIMRKIQRQAPTGYITCLIQQSLPLNEGEDERRQWHWSFVAELRWKG